MNTSAATFPAFFALLYAAHLLADYPFQTDHQAAHKAKPGREGWSANLTHATIHGITSIVLLSVGDWVLGLPVSQAASVVAPFWLAASHSFIDRRWPVALWMSKAGQAEWAERGGAAHVDQTFHVAFGVLPAALVLAAL